MYIEKACPSTIGCTASMTSYNIILLFFFFAQQKAQEREDREALGCRCAAPAVAPNVRRIFSSQPDIKKTAIDNASRGPRYRKGLLTIYERIFVSYNNNNRKSSL